MKDFNYIFVVTADSNDRDYITENYFGGKDDCKKMKEFIDYFNEFYQKYIETHDEDVQHSDLIYSLENGDDDNEEWLNFVNENEDKTKIIFDWIDEFWPESDYEYCHTLVNLDIYKIESDGPRYAVDGSTKLIKAVNE